jgi:hypothetical protein
MIGFGASNLINQDLSKRSELIGFLRKSTMCPLEAVTEIEGTIGQSTTPAEMNSSATSVFARSLTLNTEAAADSATRVI